MGAIAKKKKKNHENVNKIFLFNLFLLVYSSGLFGSNKALKELEFFTSKERFKRFYWFTVALFSGCKNKSWQFIREAVK